MQQEGEPSVEEILESIKNVIARDNRETAKGERNRRESVAPAKSPAPRSKPKKPAQPSPATIAARREEAIEAEARLDAAEDDILDLSVVMSDLAQENDAAGTDGLTTPSSTTAMRESLAALAALSGPSAQPQIVRSGETSLEGLVQDLLRPMLSQWLETNLPQIVDDQVKAEIARIAGKKR